MSDLLQLMIAPFVASMVLVALLAYLGVHVIAREVIFVDLALAQMAALGSTAALLFDVAPNSATGYAFALTFTTVGAFVFAMTRTAGGERRIPHEAIIGVVFVVASAAAILVADRAPHGADVIKEVLVGSILWVTWPTIVRLMIVYAAIGAAHWLLRRRFMTISLRPADAETQNWNVRWWDFLFYVLFGVAITMAVPVAGVLLVFTFLVVPALVAFLFTRETRRLIVISWSCSAIALAMGLAVSFRFDLPTGPVIVCTFGMVLLIAGAARQMVST